MVTATESLLHNRVACATLSDFLAVTPLIPDPPEKLVVAIGVCDGGTDGFSGHESNGFNKFDTDLSELRRIWMRNNLCVILLGVTVVMGFL